ncbi:hypothetical protein L596_027006 [Steinernema carpocapsae]|uniref:MADF domain-containing protein n=1 Tax=Steinernema carpocapsae TaxID=34508 RepID=A0A4V5ZYM4_STECR|nr:hypothetical protein L596_027006 [Steinernema carpocapsae]
MGDDHEPSFNFRLIEAVRQYRCLYDSTDRQYRSSDYKIKVWNRLVQNLGFDGDARTLYNRWKQLRDKYGKEKKKIKYQGDSTQWQYFKHLTFLDPHMVDRTQQKFMKVGKDGKETMIGGNGEEYDQQGNVVISDPNFTANLITAVQKQPCLFDIRDPKYRHSEFRNQAWADIIKTLNYPGDISSIYKQWKKVRDRYVREKRRQRMSSAEAPAPTSNLFTQMSWIDPYLDDRTTQVKRKRDSDEMSEDMVFDEIHGQMMPQYSMVDEIQHGHINGSPGISRSQHHSVIPDSPVQTIIHQPTQQQLQHPSQQQHTTNFILNPTDLVDGERAFALSVIADLRSLPEQQRELAKMRIQNLCNQRSAQIGQIITSSAPTHTQQQAQQQQYSTVS